ncbi:hypothetical protein HOI83_03610 [Candidatus Uhrbacteria bacterium]|nr:hypothetical protein [Candidatus Uhrbacteria bacterium]
MQVTVEERCKLCVDEADLSEGTLSGEIAKVMGIVAITGIAIAFWAWFASAFGWNREAVPAGVFAVLSTAFAVFGLKWLLLGRYVYEFVTEDGKGHMHRYDGSRIKDLLLRDGAKDYVVKRRLNGLFGSKGEVWRHVRGGRWVDAAWRVTRSWGKRFDLTYGSEDDQGLPLEDVDIIGATRIMRDDEFMNWQQLVSILDARDEHKANLRVLRIEHEGLIARSSRLQTEIKELGLYKTETARLQDLRNAMIVNMVDWLMDLLKQHHIVDADDLRRYYAIVNALLELKTTDDQTAIVEALERAETLECIADLAPKSQGVLATGFLRNLERKMKQAVLDPGDLVADAWNKGLSIQFRCIAEGKQR